MTLFGVGAAIVLYNRASAWNPELVLVKNLLLSFLKKKQFVFRFRHSNTDSSKLNTPGIGHIMEEIYGLFGHDKLVDVPCQGFYPSYQHPFLVSRFQPWTSPKSLSAQVKPQLTWYDSWGPFLPLTGHESNSYCFMRASRPSSPFRDLWAPQLLYSNTTARFK